MTHQVEQQDEASSVKSNRRYVLWRSFKGFCRTVIYIPLGILITVAILIGTDFGSRITVFVADSLVPDLDITYVDGAINNRLSLTNVHWKMVGVSVELDDLVLDWHPLCLLRKQLCVDELSASRVIVDVDTSIPAKEDETGIKANSSPIPNADHKVNTHIQAEEAGDDIHEEITLPFGIDLTKADLANVKVRVDDMHFNATRLQTRAQWQATGIRVNYLTSNGLLVDIPLSGDSAEQSKDKNEQAESWTMANLPQVFMPIPVFAEQVSLNNSHLRLGQRDDIFNKIEFEASYHSFLIHVEKLLVEHTYGNVILEGEISLIDDYPMDFIADINASNVKEVPSLSQQHLNLNVSGGFNKLSVEAKGQGDVDFSLNGDIALAEPRLAYQLSLTARQLGWPIDSNTYSAKDIELSTSGNTDSQKVSFSGRVNTPYHPILNVDTQLTHSGSRVDISHLRAKGLIGEVEASGHISYGNIISWDADINTIDFDMQQLALMLENPLPESFISGRLSTQGQVKDSQWHVAISRSELAGEIQGYPFELIGDLSLNEKFNLSAENLTFSALQSVLTISGTADENWAVNANLDIPDLNLWQADSSGSINAKINVSGENEHPEVFIYADVQQLQYTDIQLDHALIKGTYRPLDNQDFALSVRAGNLNYDSVKLDSITLGVKGDENKQKLRLETRGDYQVNTKVYSNFNRETETLQAEVRAFNIDSFLGAWSLEDALTVSWDNLKQTGLVTRFCLFNLNGKLCLDDPAELGENGDASLLFEGDVGAILAPLLPDNILWQAQAKLTSHIIWAENQKPQGALDLAFEPGHLSLNDNNRNVDIGYKTLALQARLDEEYLSTRLQFDSHDIASWEGKLDISVTPDRSLSGYTRLHKINLKALSEFLPQLETIEGNISSQLQIAGTLAKPSISGKLQLENGELLAAANPTLLEDIQISMSLSGQKAILEGQWQMGEGQAELSGSLDWSAEQFKGAIKLDGDNLAIIQPPFAIVNLSPNLTLNFNKDSFDVVGAIDVPSGHIKIVQLPEGGVAVSQDVVFNDRTSSGVVNQSPVALTTDIKINISDKLRIDGMGLRGKLIGTLDLKQEAFKPPLLYGDIRVIDGKYKFMGQTLDIKAGEVQFIGPLEVPNLNIEAVREIKDEDVVAGVRITGTPLKPVVTLFSSPAKEQAEILSYIIKGTGFHSNDNAQNSGLMLGAALTLTNQIGGGAVNNIGDSATGLIEKLGFSNVQLDANDDGRVAISGFIGDDLMVKYGYGVFNPGYEMTVRYYLLSQLYLETVSGTIEQSLDIYYNFDID
ncbi:translocation/assembly module TamB domain-containing protein [Shewanella eurypsychrophilus]|uniref:Translocation/assembly module TamB domain-containing protein n=1 Tax=Shewanella eurypsychrophilus TaxID=2593656 RepID=A0ABX6V5F6_9GAMM|nr:MULTISPECIES: translocation/assembly module TamB domain-containing protein [Shewanella]QFU22562.1 hypothetical protein FS418_12160 [Shewanella sp. YLB-09]QPG57851.1 translocation/assembly module TamB domain-containing protein [Shewanella eurypsychrophilus]